MDFCSEDGKNVVLKVRVVPNAKNSEIKDLWNNRLRVRVAAPPEGGKANDALEILLAKELDIKNVNVNVVDGFKSRDKLIEIAGISIEDLQTKLNKGQAKLAV